MKKTLLVVAAVLVALAGAGFWLYHEVDLLVKLALEHYGPQVAGVSVKVDEVRLSPKDGRGVLRGVEIGNPPGFTAPRAARLGEVTMAVEPATLRAPVVLIHEIAIVAPTITYERAGKTTNLDAIAKNIESYVKASEASPDGKQASGKDARHLFIIERLTIRGAKVTMTNPALKGQGVTFDLPDIRLDNIGRARGGVTASEAARQVTNALLAGIAARVLSNIDLLRQGGVEGAIDALKGLFR
jgi:hypothetical protein